jgi:hypothetical protein
MYYLIEMKKRVMEEMDNKPLELRMYFFVPYNISPIQQAIQAGHAALEYARKFGQSEIFQDFVNNWKTWIILNGGTTNSRRDLSGEILGSLDQIGDILVEHEIEFAWFNEPDLNDALTAICLICDERVFNREDYPDFLDYILNIAYPKNDHIPDAKSVVEMRMTPIEELQTTYSEYYKEWVRFIGGVNNVFLREVLKGKKLA